MTHNGMLRLIAAIAAIACPAPAAAQVYKCIDRNGRVTYQQQPCPNAPKEQRLDIFIGNRPELAADGTDPWADPVSKKVIAVGMPRATVVRAVGSPQQIRAGTAGDGAAEVWIYRRPDLDKRVGFREGIVVWTKEGGEEAVAPPTVLGQTVERGRDCGSLNLALAQSIDSETDAELGRPVVRYTFPATPPDTERTSVICDGGVVARVDRVPN